MLLAQLEDHPVGYVFEIIYQARWHFQTVYGINRVDHPHMPSDGQPALGGQ